MKLGIFNIILFLFLVSLFLENIYEPLRYVKYFLPALAMVPYLSTGPVPFQRGYFSYLTSFLVFYVALIVFLLVKALAFGLYNDRFLPNALFILSPLLLILLLVPYFKEERIKRYVTLAFILNVILFLFQQGKNLSLVIANPSALREAVLSSTVSTENQLAFALGFFLFYFLVEKYPLRYILICALIFILSFKRIAIGAFAASYLFYLFATKSGIDVKRHRWTLAVVLVIANLLFIELIIIIVNGQLDEAIKQYTDFSTNKLLMGRQAFYYVLFQNVDSISWTGLGLGHVDKVLFSAFNAKQNLHSDILKNYFEFGVIFFIVWIILLTYKTAFSNKSFAVFIYFNILMLTDNVFIYFDFMFYFYFFVLLCLSEVKNTDRRSIVASS